VAMPRAMADIYLKFPDIDKGSYEYFLIPFTEIELQSVLKNLTGLRRNHHENAVSVLYTEITDRKKQGLNCLLMKKILCLMDAKFDDDRFGIREVCNALGISRAQMYRKFKTMTDSTPHEFLRTYRLQRAKELLLTTDHNVSEVAYLTGFKNISHFSRVFKEEFGKNPGKFQKLSYVTFSETFRKLNETQ
jgi:AraC-like DNA-binding protein